MTRTTILGVEQIERMHIHSIDTPLSLDEMKRYQDAGWDVRHCEDLHEGSIFKGRCYLMDRSVAGDPADTKVCDRNPGDPCGCETNPDHEMTINDIGMVKCPDCGQVFD